MSVFNNIKIELVILLIVTVSIFTFSNIDFEIHKFVNETSENLYLIEFFKNITILGSSAWYFGISFFFIVAIFFFKKIEILKLKKIDTLINFFISSFFYLLTIGITTQIGKHLFGRARPNYTNFEDQFNFNIFSFESSHHSFPSGHSSTIFMVCLILCAVLPKLKYWFYFLASIIALSRVIVGAHFFTDIVAGALLSLIVFKVLNLFIYKSYKNYSFSEIVFNKDGLVYYFVIFLLSGALFLTVGPSLDIYISELFYFDNNKFFLQNYDLLSKAFREFFLPLILIYVLILPIVGVYFKIEKIFFGYKFNFREIFLIWLSQIISVLLFVNLIFKNLWGRARPDDILELGGKDFFTPWYKLSSACDTNCSFVSGDASVGFSIIVLYFITKNTYFIYCSIISGFVLGLIRIIAGGHFLSDILFAGLVVIVLNLILFRFLKKTYE